MAKAVKKEKEINKYAVIRIKGRQYKVSEGEELFIDKAVDPKKIDVEVLLLVDGDSVKVGTPKVSDASVKIKVLEEVSLGEKIHVRKYKAKSRFRKHIGFRPQYTKILVEKIS